MQLQSTRFHFRELDQTCYKEVETVESQVPYVADQVINAVWDAVTSNSKVQNFENFFAKRCKKYPGALAKRQLYTGIALNAAIHKGNVAFINEIAKEMGSSILNTKNHEDVTPLYFAVNLHNQEKGLKASKTLIGLGADINLLSKKYIRYYVKTGSEFETPLDAVISESNAGILDLNKEKLIQLLFLNGAAIWHLEYPHIEQNIEISMNKLFEDVKLLFLAKHDQGSSISIFDQDVTNQLAAIATKIKVLK